MNFADEIFDHLFGDFEVGDDPVTQRADGMDITGRTAKHLLSFSTDCYNLASLLINSYNRWFINNNPLSA